MTRGVVTNSFEVEFFLPGQHSAWIANSALEFGAVTLIPLWNKEDIYHVRDKRHGNFRRGFPHKEIFASNLLTRIPPGSTQFPAPYFPFGLYDTWSGLNAALIMYSLFSKRVQDPRQSKRICQVSSEELTNSAGVNPDGSCIE